MIAIVDESLKGKILRCDGNNVIVSPGSDENGVPIEHQVSINEIDQIIGPTLKKSELQDLDQFTSIFSSAFLTALFYGDSFDVCSGWNAGVIAEFRWIVKDDIFYPLNDETENFVIFASKLIQDYYASKK